MPLLDDIHLYLTQQSGLITTAWPLFISYMPDERDQVIAIFETGGIPPETLMRENENVTFQSRVRGGRLDYQAVRQKWRVIFDALQDSIPAVGYAFVQAMQDGPMVFNDPSGRVNMVSNWRVKKSRT